MKDQLGRKVMKEFAALRAKTYSYLTYNNSKDKKAKCTKNCVIKRIFKLFDFKICLEVT